MLALLAQNVRAARNEKNMTQQQLAEETNLTTLSISNIERAAVWPKPETLDALATALDLRPYELFIDAERDTVIPKEAFNKEIELLIRELRSYSKSYEKVDDADFVITHSRRSYS